MLLLLSLILSHGFNPCANHLFLSDLMFQGFCYSELLLLIPLLKLVQFIVTDFNSFCSQRLDASEVGWSSLILGCLEFTIIQARHYHVINRINPRAQPHSLSFYLQHDYCPLCRQQERLDGRYRKVCCLLFFHFCLTYLPIANHPSQLWKPRLPPYLLPHRHRQSRS